MNPNPKAINAEVAESGETETYSMFSAHSASSALQIFFS